MHASSEIPPTIPPAMPIAAPRLGVNIDHVATVRNARGGSYPDPVAAALTAERAGADGITAHLREDRRHIKDSDIERLCVALSKPLNLEMAPTAEMQQIALKHSPHAVCLVPEKREELTTEGGLDVAAQKHRLADFIAPLKEAGCRVSLFIAPDERQIDAAAAIGVPVVELHTGIYAEYTNATDAGGENTAYQKLRAAAAYGQQCGLEIHAGHGLHYDNVAPIAALAEVRELNIGHFLIAQSIFLGLDCAVREMRQRMFAARVQP